MWWQQGEAPWEIIRAPRAAQKDRWCVGRCTNPQVYNHSYEAEITSDTMRLSLSQNLLQTFSHLSLTIMLGKRCKTYVSSFHRSGN